MKKFMAGLVIALGMVFFLSTPILSGGPAEACCIGGDDSSSSNWYDGGRGDDWSGRGNTYGYQDRSLIGRYDSYGYGDDRASSSGGYDWGTGYFDRGSSNYDQGLSGNYNYAEGLGSYNYGPSDPLYRANNYVGTQYDYGLGSNYDYDSYSNRSYQETVRPLDAYDVRHTSWLGRYLQGDPWSFKVDLSALCGFWC